MVPAASGTVGMKVRGLPTPSSDATSSAGPDRSNAFQVLADGTQDLAALVGLFATDSVEGYSFDYSRGFLGAAMSTCSLLGLLGYCRGLLKLAMGSHACGQSAFSTTMQRPYMGVAEKERLPSEELTEVRYLERRKRESDVEWRVVKILRHTDESMPLTANRRKSDVLADKYSVIELILAAEKNILRSRLAFLWVPGSVALTTGATSFTILPFDGGFGWTRLYATFGLFASILTGSLCWAWVYSQEQLPPGRSPWWSSRWGGLPPHAKSGPGMSLERKNSFAYYQYNRAFFIFNCRGVHGTQEKMLRAVSFAAAISAAISYVCQYIELRRLPPRWSGVWLAIQGLLALLRITLWIAQPSFQSFEANKATLVRKQANRFSTSFTETELVLLWSALQDQDASSAALLKSLVIPNWVVANIDHCTLPDAFGLAKRMRGGTAELSEIEACQKSPRWWDLPTGVFGFWLRLRGNEEFAPGTRLPYTIIPSVDLLWRDAACRIIQDPASGQLHFFPGLSSPFAHHVQSDLNQTATIYTFSENIEENTFSFRLLEERFPTGRQRFYRNNEDAKSDGVKLSWGGAEYSVTVSREMMAAIDKACEAELVNWHGDVKNVNGQHRMTQGVVPPDP
ncbi:MAG: hypothetical protein M1813_006743 [Trichoglossum hirsutum]|nr:MAG: hypothetical protein M1813_006743 [Trichoglossum hirsutum]